MDVEQGQRALVLGAGFIGSALARELLGRGFEVTVLSRSAPGLLPTDGVNLVLGDAGEMATLATLVAETDHVVYALGSSSPAESELDPATDVAAVLPPLIRLLELMRLRPAVSLTFVSSGGAIYGNADGVSLSETTQPSPISSYGLLKLTCEKYIAMYRQRYDLSTRILRVSNAYGPGQSWSGGQGVIAHLMRSAYTGEPIPLYGSATCVRDFLYITDIARAAADLIGRDDGPEVVNVGSGVGHTIDDVVSTIEEVSGNSIKANRHKARKFDVQRNVLDCTVLNTLVDFDPIDLRSGIAKTWQAAVSALGREDPVMTARRAPAPGR